MSFRFDDPRDEEPNYGEYTNGPVGMWAALLLAFCAFCGMIYGLIQLTT